MLDTWTITQDDIGKIKDVDPQVIAKAQKSGRVWGLGDPSTGDITCMLFVSKDGSPVVLTNDTVGLTSE